jgi:amino acid transporter
MTEPRRVLGLRQIVAVSVVAIFTLRGIPGMAKFGWGSLTLLGISFLAFFVPLALAVIALSARDPGEGGLFRWSTEAFGPLHGFLCGWTYLISNVVYLPAVLSHFAAVLPWLLFGRNMAFAQDPRYVLGVTLGALWLLGVLPNLLGARRTGQLSQLAMAGLLGGTALLIFFAVMAVMRGIGAAVPADTWMPSFASGTRGFLSTYAFALVGLELASTMGGEVVEARRTLIRGTLLAGAIVTLLSIVAVAAVVMGMNAKDIPLADGIPAAVAMLAPQLGLSMMMVRGVALCLLLAAVGGLAVWLSGVARLARAAGVAHALPAWFARESPRFGTPVAGFVAQAAGASLFLCLSVAGSSVRQAYYELTSLSAILTYIPFLYIFGATIRAGGRIMGTLGLLTTLASLSFSFLPTDEVSNVWVYEVKIVAVTAGLIGLGLALYFSARRRTHPL